MKRTTVSSQRDAKKSYSSHAKKTVPSSNNTSGSKGSYRCPMCRSPTVLHIKVATRKGNGEATIVCAACVAAGVGNQGSISYPYHATFLPKLEQKVDVYYKFRDHVEAMGLTGCNVDIVEEFLKQGGKIIQISGEYDEIDKKITGIVQQQQQLHTASTPSSAVAAAAVVATAPAATSSVGDNGDRHVSTSAAVVVQDDNDKDDEGDDPLAELFD